jgi:hypothetical protein
MAVVIEVLSQLETISITKEALEVTKQNFLIPSIIENKVISLLLFQGWIINWSDSENVYI